jgi:5-methylcytosine-specific restriction endonuclease McrA
LQIDHIVPFAKGGKTEASNLRTLCRAHNLLMAELEFGREKVYFHQGKLGLG